MAQMGRRGLSAEQKRELWQRWSAGQSLTEIGRALGKHSSSIHFVITTNGGCLPRMRTRRSTTLALVEREEISRGLADGSSLRAIATALGRGPLDRQP
jgi:IS30 family transposase